MEKLLMSQENPKGHKLEELLNRIRVELKEKSQKLDYDDCPVSRIIRRNNGYIESLLDIAENIQRESMGHLDTLGEDTGPHGNPRL